MVVRMRANRSHTNNRRSHQALKRPALSKENGTGSMHLRHRANPATGMYRGRLVIDVAKRAAKKEKKMKAAGAQA